MTARESLAPPAEGPACPASLVSPASLASLASLVRAHRKIRR
ncbi:MULTISPECIES: hypothetical protein [Streptomyces]|nr:hypothetical protein [Streptomyces sp. KAI 90]WDI17117.1 hypothetical protein PS783_05790 [Streptomyces enissocaesilis]